MAHKRMKVLAPCVAAAMLAAACGGGGSKSSSGSHTFTVGVLTDVTGIAASSGKTFPQGVLAGTKLASRDGYTIKYVVADTTSSPTGALGAAQKLVQQDHVFAVLALSAFAFGGAPYLNSQGVPVIGVAEDGPEWLSLKNMFSVFGAIHTDLVTTTLGQLFKLLGVTNVGTLGYGISPTSAQAAKGTGKSAEAVGLKAGYVNANFPFGSTDVQPIALAMKNAGVDGFYATVDPNTGFALISALRQSGADVKAAVLPTGYGGDLLQAGPGALQAAQNVYFTVTFEPVEMNDGATQQLVADLKAASVTSEPTYAQYAGYLSVGLLVQGLRAAGSNPTRVTLINALSAMHNWDALGLLGNHPIDFNNRDNYGGSCVWVVKLAGSSFQLVPGADPVCGDLVPGVTVGASS